MGKFLAIFFIVMVIVTVGAKKRLESKGTPWATGTATCFILILFVFELMVGVLWNL